ncbi:MAG: diol dehydratase small subunit [Gammaproteobacteria bacterium]|nr:diol dehydratase small subunit [Gammaproteobacteria bacterium]
MSKSVGLSVSDYPLAENRPELVRTGSGKSLDELTLDSVMDGEIGLDDFRITSAALRQQAEIARAAGRATLAANLERGAEMVDLPQDLIMRIYELLRPGRSDSPAPLLEAAEHLRDTHGATLLAALLEEAAVVYERRGLFSFRY